MSPEAQKILGELANLKENATPEESQKAMSKMSTDLAKLSVDKCGEDPNKYSGQWRQDQVAKAEAAGIREFSAGLGTKPGPALSANSDDDDWFYRLLKEWIPPFCLLSKALQQEAAAKGVKVPGAGTNFNYVYSSTEASLLIPLCDILMPILRDLQ